MARQYIQVNVNLGTSIEDEELKQWLRETAAARGVSMSALAKGLLRLARGKALAKERRAASGD